MLYEMKYTEDFTNKVKSIVKTKKAWKRFFTKIAKKTPDFPTAVCWDIGGEYKITISEYITMLINTKDLIPMEAKHGR